MAIDTAISFLIPSAAVGSVIGKGGQNLQQLRQQYDVQVSINSECEPDTNENNVTLIGRLESVQAIHHRIIQYVVERTGGQVNSRGKGESEWKGEPERKGDGYKGKGPCLFQL